MRDISYLFMFLGLILQASTLASPFDLSPFETVGNANWKSSGEVVEADSGQGFLVTKASYGDFRLSVEFYSDYGTNSGIFFRCSDQENISDKTCYEANIYDLIQDPMKRTGAIVGIEPAQVKMETEGRWNRYEITATGSRLLVKLNGQVTVDIQDGTHQFGSIALQYREGKIKFRNFSLDSLDKSVQGVWDLTEFKLDDGKGTVTQWCEGAFGSIIYTKQYMSVAINCDTDPSKMVLYSGPYHVEGDTVVHQVRNYSDPKLHQVFRRGIEMPSNDTLNLIGPFGDSGKAIVSWIRRK